MKIKTLALLLPLFASSAFAAPLQLDVYNPQDKAIFPVSSTLVSGPKEAILFDAQFSTKDGEQLVQMIRASGKTLKAIVITSGDPDFYFGLQPIVKAFPQVKVLATPQVVDHIRATKEAKLQFWGPQMKDGAPTSLTVPQATTQTQFTVDGETLELRHANDYAAYIWIPANRAIIGGTGVASGIHVWTADTQSEQQRSAWRSVLSEMQSLQPTQVVPGHYIGERPTGDKAIRFTQDYLQSFELALGAKKGSDYVIKTMTAAWPGLADVSSLELSAKVNSGEMKW
ncbi:MULTISPECIES: Vmh family MBL fold metallo-hydrolase [Citrobacter]|uniref:Vmh family MBL fold metallo-hydrolase n=1 Tax=Citrobacter TaxID=544 RepID=UPI0011F06070|nr:MULTISPECIES: Vmh family MBL fold metallo-hydrolase [Citrobacter]QPO97560.1 MBL fold metallo-hydrolase [Citrobacter freundii]KAA0561941.1 MBL fold metallo-hydrolase [Citrobacter portucalensis]MCE9794926.1 Vmh family MBL fold metallo-hydrolase [Citrobacter portucalensis]MCH2697301.1 MBL fold metallo-hydrolase [Citrobacter portucalensis]MCX9033429.1 Vmh family MBL fold metallo-hydrolase [Citrobacter portucalensis]